MSQKKVNEKNIISNLRVAVGAVDVVLFTILDDKLHVLLIPIHRPPHYVHLQGLPGGIIEHSESADAAVFRHLKTKLGVSGIQIEQLYTFSDPKRDKRSRSISIAYMGLITQDNASLKDKTEGEWFNIHTLPKLAFDHKEIIKVAVDRLKGKVTYTTIVSNLLPKQFTLSELQYVNEVILGEQFDKRNFRKKILASGLIAPTGKKKKTIKRPAELYIFTK